MGRQEGGAASGQAGWRHSLWAGGREGRPVGRREGGVADTGIRGYRTMACWVLATIVPCRQL